MNISLRERLKTHRVYAFHQGSLVHPPVENQCFGIITELYYAPTVIPRKDEKSYSRIISLPENDKLVDM